MANPVLNGNYINIGNHHFFIDFTATNLTTVKALTPNNYPTIHVFINTMNPNATNLAQLDLLRQYIAEVRWKYHKPMTLVIHTPLMHPSIHNGATTVMNSWGEKFAPRMRRSQKNKYVFLSTDRHVQGELHIEYLNYPWISSTNLNNRLTVTWNGTLLGTFNTV